MLLAREVEEVGSTVKLTYVDTQRERERNLDFDPSELLTVCTVHGCINAHTHDRANAAGCIERAVLLR